VSSWGRHWLWYSGKRCRVWLDIGLMRFKSVTQDSIISESYCGSAVKCECIHGNEMLVMMEKGGSILLWGYFLKEPLSVNYQVPVGYRFFKPAVYLLVLLSNVTMHTLHYNYEFSFIIFFLLSSNFFGGPVLNQSVLLRATENINAFWFLSFYELFLFKYIL
jgi:hypothetical protein